MPERKTPTMAPLSTTAKMNTFAQDIEHKMGEFPPLKLLQSPAGELLSTLLPFMKLFKGEPAHLDIDNNPVTPRLPNEFLAVGDEPPYERPRFPEPYRPSARSGGRSSMNIDNGLRRRKTDGQPSDK